MPCYKFCNILLQQFSWVGQKEGLLGEAIFIVKSHWRSPYNKLGGSKYTQPQYIGDFHINILRNNICGQQGINTINIINDTLSIASVSTKQLINIKSRCGLSPNNSIVYLPEEFIILTLCLKKRLTNIQLHSKLPFTL